MEEIKNIANPYSINYGTTGEHGDGTTKTTTGSASFDYGSQRDEQSDLTQRYGDAIRGQENRNTAWGRLNDQYGVPGLQETNTQLNNQIRSINNQLTNMPATMVRNSGNSNMTQAQIDQATMDKTQQMQPTLQNLSQLSSDTTQRLATQQANASAAMSALEAQQDRELLAFEKEYNQQEIQQAREFTGYTMDAQRELNRILQDIQNGMQVSEAKLQRAHELAVHQAAYQQQLELMRAEAAMSAWLEGQGWLGEQAIGGADNPYGVSIPGGSPTTPTTADMVANGIWTGNAADYVTRPVAQTQTTQTTQTTPNSSSAFSIPEGFGERMKAFFMPWTLPN